MSARALVAAVAVSSLLAAPATLDAADRATPGQKQYLQAVVAYDGADYETAVRLLRSAIAADATEGLAKFSATGLNKEDYLPHYYLGLSLEKLGQKAAALAELQESARQGAIRGRGSASRILDTAIARLEPPKIAQLPPTATPRPVAPTAPPPPTARPTRAVPPTPRPTAVVEPPPAEERATPTPRPAAPTRSLPTATPRPSAPSQPVQADESLAAAREGIRTYFKGDYASAVRQLEPLAGRVPAARLFLAYALASAQLVLPAQDDAVVNRARSEYETAKRDLKTVDEKLISPAVLALLGPTRK